MKFNVEFDTVVEADSLAEAEAVAEYLAQRTRKDNPIDIVTMDVAVVIERRSYEENGQAPVFDLDTIQQ